MDYKTLYIIMEYNALMAGSALVVWTEHVLKFMPQTVVYLIKLERLGHNVVGYEYGAS